MPQMCSPRNHKLYCGPYFFTRSRGTNVLASMMDTKLEHWAVYKTSIDPNYWSIRNDAKTNITNVTLPEVNIWCVTKMVYHKHCISHGINFSMYFFSLGQMVSIYILNSHSELWSIEPFPKSLWAITPYILPIHTVDTFWLTGFQYLMCFIMKGMMKNCSFNAGVATFLVLEVVLPLPTEEHLLGF